MATITNQPKLDYIIGRPHSLHLEPPALDPDWTPDLGRTGGKVMGPASRVRIERGHKVIWGDDYRGTVVGMDRDTVEVRTPLLGVELTGWFPVANLKRVSESCWQYEGGE